ncbi:MAG: hypothetical protein J6D37_08180 [Clostridia bacterium]|nr:hypothetical protein [Clostridia bacterium]
MYIDWNTLKSAGQLDYFSVTIQNGQVQKQRAYYLREKNSPLATGIDALDDLIFSGYARCFSNAIGTDGNYRKLDLTVQSDFHAIILQRLEKTTCFSFYQCLSDFENFISENKMEFLNNIIGTTISKENRLKNLCFYYKNMKIDEISWLNCFLDKYRIDDLVFPELNEKGWIQLLAFDFSEKGTKIKIYFKFKRSYPLNNILEIFGNENKEIAKEIIMSNGFIEGLQVAVGRSMSVSYNFYFKE